MKTVAYLVLTLAAPAFAEPAYYEAFDFKNCLHWKIDNEMYGDDLNSAPKPYIAALNLANRQPHSRHKSMSADELDRMYREHPEEVAVVYSARAYDRKKQRDISKYGVCTYAAGLRCLPNQDFPLAGASYKKSPSRGKLAAEVCVSGCADVPTAIHDMGYENLDGAKNVEREAAFEKHKRKCGRAP